MKNIIQKTILPDYLSSKGKDIISSDLTAVNKNL